MKNNECVIYVVGKNGRVYQSFRREIEGWTVTSGNGTVRRCTAEQLLSHILPPLAGVSQASVRVERPAAAPRKGQG